MRHQNKETPPVPAKNGYAKIGGKSTLFIMPPPRRNYDMKRFAAVIAVPFLILSLPACGGGSSPIASCPAAARRRMITRPTKPLDPVTRVVIARPHPEKRRGGRS